MSAFDKAIQLLKQGNLQEGRKILERLYVQHPEDISILYNLGMCYSELGMLDKSIEILEKCIEIEPLHVEANTALGVSYSRKGMNEKAESRFRVALEMEPDNFYALRNLGAVLANKRKYDEAIHFFERAQKINPSQPEVMYGLALALNETGKTEEAEKLLHKIIAEDKNSQITELSRRVLSEIAMKTYKSKGLRMDAVMYMLSALEKFSSMDIEEVKRITFEIGLLGRKGFEINNPEKKYKLQSMKGEFTGIQLVSYMYVGFKMIDGNINTGADLENEYQSALNLFRRKQL